MKDEWSANTIVFGCCSDGCTVGLGAELKYSGKFRRGEFESENMSDNEYKVCVHV